MPTSLYQSLPDITAGKIRLLYLDPGVGQDLNCELRVGDHLDSPPYEALSYVWGAETEKKIGVTINECSFPVTPNLESALRHLRHPVEKRILWIDQICINQESNAEKSDQVRAMGRIYEEASKVLVWLGWQTISSSNPLVRLDFTETDWIHVRQLVDIFSNSKTHLDSWPCFDTSEEGTFTASKDFAGPFDALDRFMRLPWWSRIWTAQEICLARRGDLFVGSHSTPWEDFERAVGGIDSHRNRCCTQLFASLPSGVRRVIDNFKNPIWDIMRHRPPPTSGFGTYCDSILTLQKFRHRESTDPRDKIYGVLGLQNLLCISPAYDQTFSQVYIDLTLRLINISLDLLILVGDNYQTHRRHPDLPSWAVDWRYISMKPHRYRSRFYQYLSFSASKITAAAPQLLGGSLLKLRGRKIGTITHIPFAYTFPRWSDAHGAFQRLVASQKTSSPPGEPYVLGGTMEEALWRTMINDRIFEGPRGVRPATKDDEPYFQAYMSGTYHPRSRSTGEAYHLVAGACETTLYNRNFLYTSEGLIGTGPVTAEVGDEVWVLFGGNVPFVIRSTSSSPLPVAGEFRCTLRGDCYLHGIMNGEAMDWPEDAACWVVLS